MNQILEFLNLSHPYMRSYLDDLLVMPILLTVALVVMRILLKNKTFELDAVMLVMAFVMISVLFEIILPNYSDRYTRGSWDVLCYAIGTFLYVWFRKRSY